MHQNKKKDRHNMTIHEKLECKHKSPQSITEASCDSNNVLERSTQLNGFHIRNDIDLEQRIALGWDCRSTGQFTMQERAHERRGQRENLEGGSVKQLGQHNTSFRVTGACNHRIKSSRGAIQCKKTKNNARNREG